MLQITNAPRSSGKELAELHEAALALVARINGRWGSPGYSPVAYLERHVPLHERIAFYTVRHGCLQDEHACGLCSAMLWLL